MWGGAGRGGRESAFPCCTMGRAGAATTPIPLLLIPTEGKRQGLGREPVHARSDTHTTSSPLGQSSHGALTEILRRGDGSAQSSGHSKTLLLTGASSDPTASEMCLQCDSFLLEEEKSSLGLCVCVRDARYNCSSEVSKPGRVTWWSLYRPVALGSLLTS